MALLARPPDTPKRLPKNPKRPPIGSQEASKRSPHVFQGLQEPRPGPQDAPSVRQEAAGDPLPLPQRPERLPRLVFVVVVVAPVTAPVVLLAMVQVVGMVALAVMRRSWW